MQTNDELKNGRAKGSSQIAAIANSRRSRRVLITQPQRQRQPRVYLTESAMKELISAIGPQNVEILRETLRKRRILTTEMHLGHLRPAMAARVISNPETFLWN